MRSFGTLLAGALLGTVLFGLVRFAALPSVEPTHYHANWALWIDGERVDLTDDRYMEDVAACATDGAPITGRQRAHMHENNHDIVHVHHDGVTWGHLFQNIGWALGPDFIVTDEGEIYRDGEGGRITAVMNGLVVPAVYDRTIQRGDRLLLSFGTETANELVSERFPSVSSDAPEFDLTFDPAGCSGHEPETSVERLRRAFWF